MSAKQGIWVEGERELFLKMQKTLDGSLKAGMKGLEKATMNISFRMVPVWWDNASL